MGGMDNVVYGRLDMNADGDKIYGMVDNGILVLLGCSE